ncbi:MAG: site-specific integrase [Deltaproteobacteria bacterium]|nr:site-specific integrase [Deltaproteobacteria bacterium]
MSRTTRVEKETVMTAFFAHCRQEGIDGLQGVTRPGVYKFLAAVADERGPNRANVYRKNLLAAWNWGIGFVDGFPQSAAVIESIKPFPATRKPRYVPPEEDVIKVLQLVQGQDMVFLMAMYFTGARRGELFRLSWGDIDLMDGRIRLIDHKGGGGQERPRWLAMHPELVKVFAWWREARPCAVDNVFMQTQCHSFMGQPYKARTHFMDTLCARAGVKPFGFHAIRHKSAATTFVAKGLNAAQILMGHSRATTTDIYVRSAGLYADQGAILEALSASVIGQAVSGLIRESECGAEEVPHRAEKVMPLKGATSEAFCTQELVHSRLQQPKKHITL